MTERSPGRSRPPRSWTLGILAGGKSTRMGRDKAGVMLGGRTMLEHVAARCGPHSGEILISSGPAGRALDAPWRVVADQAGAGPLSGIHALCGAVATPHLVVVACDMPYLDRAVLELLLDALDDGAEAAFFRGGKGPEPLPMALRAAPARLAADALIAEEAFRIIGLADRLRCSLVPSPSDPTALTNVNTADDLEAAAKFFASLS